MKERPRYSRLLLEVVFGDVEEQAVVVLAQHVVGPFLQHRHLLAGLLSTLLAASSQAIPEVAVDVDPSAPGIQAIRDVLLGPSLTVDVAISGVEVGNPLNGFEFDLNFDPSVLAPTLVIDGGVLASG